MTFDEFCSSLVQRYLNDKDSCCSESAIRNYYTRLTIEEAIKAAINRGYYEINARPFEDDHYQHFPQPSLDEAREFLLRLLPKFRLCKSFMEVHDLVQGCTFDITPNLKRLFWYDTSLRIASSFEISKQPEDVFIHAGTEVGAQSLGIDLRVVTDLRPYLPKKFFSRVSSTFDRLMPDQIESLLCIYHRDITAFFGRPKV